MTEETRPLGDLLYELMLLVDWVKANPTLPTPFSIEVSFIEANAEATKKMIAAVARSLPKCKKTYYSDTFSLRYYFGDSGIVSVRAVASRDEVCTKRVIGTKDVPEQVIPAHKEEIVEWDCHPILASEPEPQHA